MKEKDYRFQGNPHDQELKGALEEVLLSHLLLVLLDIFLHQIFVVVLSRLVECNLKV